MFHEFDKDGSGAISIEEAKLMLRRLDIPDEEVGTSAVVSLEMIQI